MTDPSELEAIAVEAIAAMERDLQLAMLELIRHDQEFAPSDRSRPATAIRHRPAAA